MSRDGAYPDEMAPFDEINDAEAGRLLAEHGHDAEAGLYQGDLAAFVRALPAAIPTPPNPAIEARLVPALADAARVSGLQAGSEETRPMRTVSAFRGGAAWRLRLAVVAAAIALLPLLMAGLAYAGVALPEPVDEAFDAVGIELPNQAETERENGHDARGRAADERESRAAGDETPDEQSATGPAAEHADGNSGNGDGNGNRGNGNEGQGGGRPTDAGPESTPPGQGGVPPGQGGVPPGNSGVPPGGGSGGSTGPPPSAGPPATPPGQGGTPPGQGGTPPGQSGAPSGHSGTPPGQGGTPPGQAKPKPK